MNARIHLPHLHVADVAEALKDAAHHFHKPKPVYTDPAVIERWREWLTPEEWEREHHGGGER